jgi:hypothetical protein
MPFSKGVSQNFYDDVGLANIGGRHMTTKSTPSTTQAQTVDTRIGKLDFELGVPTKETVTNLYDQMDFQRACQLYLWAWPIVGSEQLRATLEGTAGALPGDVGIYGGYRNVRSS